MFFTDALVEHRGRSIDQGLRMLAALAGQQGGESVERLCDALIEECPGDDSDDIAVLALRLPA